MSSLRYVTSANFVNQVPENMQGLLTNDGNTLSPDSDVVKAALLSAEQTVESYMAERYDLPLTSDGTKTGEVPEKIKEVVFILAKYQLYGRRDAITQEVKVQYDSAMSWLGDVARGRASVVLLDSNDEVVDEGDVGIVVSSKTESQFKNEDFV